MIQTLLERCDTTPTSTLARRDLLPAPVLIRVPTVVTARVSRAPARRRRLRREVRLAGYLLLVAVPASLACLGLGFDRLPTFFGLVARAEAGARLERAGGGESPRNPSVISLSLEPMLASHGARDLAEAPVLLSGQLLPADVSEEPSHGGN